MHVKFSTQIQSDDAFFCLCLQAATHFGFIWPKLNPAQAGNGSSLCGQHDCAACLAVKLSNKKKEESATSQWQSVNDRGTKHICQCIWVETSQKVLSIKI